MKRLFFLLLVLATACGARAIEYEPYQGSRIFWDMSSRQTVFPTGWYARIIQLQDGRLMAVCEHGGIEVRYATSGVWSDGKIIASGHDNIGMRVPDLIQLTDGTIVVAYNPRPEEPYTTDRKFGIRVKRSTDNGQTWGPEIFVYDAQHLFTDGCWEPSLLELPSGELQLYFSNEGIYTSSNEQNISLCRSFDGGLTWSEPEIISFRAGYRDGMPCPILLNDQSEIVLTIEDNGWPGVGDFFPTTVRCPLSVNWHNYFVDKDSPNREKTLDFNFCPNATGGAPYLRQLPWGETVMSYQSAYGRDGRLSMYVALGDREARHFKSMQHPFYVDQAQTVMWNSLCVVDTGQVVALGGVGSSIQMIKGYAMSTFLAPYAHPAIDGQITRDEGYFQPLATQIRMGVETGTATAADVCYDDDSLYFCIRVADRTPFAYASNGADCVTLFIDALNRSSRAPLDGMYRFFLRRDGSHRVAYGTDSKKKWSYASEDNVRTAVVDKSTSYTLEAAIPWTDLGLSHAPQGTTLRMNIEMQDYRQGESPDLVVEDFVDAQRDASWSWMPLYLQPNPNPSAVPAVAVQESANAAGVFDLQGRRMREVPASGVFIRNGKKYIIK